MRKTTIFILLAISIMAVFADDVVKVLQVYSGGKKVSIPVSNIDSLNHSMYNTDNILLSDYATSVAWTIDSIYYIPITSIDSMVIGDYDVNQYKQNVESIMDFISRQTELDVGVFQNNLLEWLNGKETIREATINNNKDIITVTFKDGLSFFINFQDFQFFVNPDEKYGALNIASKKEEEKNLFYDVSYQNGEEIIENPNILFVQCREMNLDESVAAEEKNAVEINISKSPIQLNNEYVSKDLKFLGYNWKTDFGLILVSQTHGLSNVKGGFQVEDAPCSVRLGNNIISIYYKDGLIRSDINSYNFTNTVFYYIMPQLIAAKLRNSKAIYLGNYCFSYGINKYLKGSSCVIYGNTAISNYFYNLKVIKNFTKELFSGSTVADAYNYVQKEAGINWHFPLDEYGWHGFNEPTINKESKRRYFSISTENVTEYSNTGNPIIKGQINGFKNLKSDINYYVYAFDKNEKLNYADITTKGKRINKETFSKDDTGTFSFEYPDLTITETPEEYQFVVGFRYGGVTYYGPTKTLGYTLCPDSNHPHWIDLGLPSGTLWRCCNEGASMPESYGGYYIFGQVSSAPSADQIEELVNNTISYGSFLLNDVCGSIFIGKNGVSIFLPAAGYRWDGELHGVGELGYYWSSSWAPNKERYGACYFNISSSNYFWDWNSFVHRGIGLSVRPVR